VERTPEQKLIILETLREILDALNQCTTLESPTVSGFIGKTAQDARYISPDPVPKIGMFAFKLQIIDKIELLQKG